MLRVLAASPPLLPTLPTLSLEPVLFMMQVSISIYIKISTLCGFVKLYVHNFIGVGLIVWFLSFLSIFP